MPAKRITVWVQHFPDRKNLMLQWHDPDTGRRKSQSARTADPRAAEQARIDLEADLNHGRYAEASRMTWERFRELFEEEYLPNVRTRTGELYRGLFDQFEEVCNPRLLRSITERTVSAFVAGLRKRKLKSGKIGMDPTTIQARLRNLHAALAWAVEQKFLPEVPAFPTINVPRKRPQPVPTEAVEKLLGKADPPMRVYLLCGWLAGLRRNEALALEREATEKAPWVDFDRGRIVLQAELVKADEDQWVPLDDELREALLSLPKRGKRFFHFEDQAGESIAPSSVGKRIGTLAKQAGVKLTMKTLRRGFGCRYASKVSAQVLQRLMRHSDITITMAYYANIDEAVEEAVWGSKRNSSRNIRSQRAGEPGELLDATNDDQQGSDDTDL